MLYREIMAVCSEIHTKHINTVCGQNVEFVNVKPVVNIVKHRLEKVNTSSVQNISILFPVSSVVKTGFRPVLEPVNTLPEIKLKSRFFNCPPNRRYFHQIHDGNTRFFLPRNFYLKQLPPDKYLPS